ncbi:MAG: hypothetical protein ACPGVD_03635 [Flavobacteriales bacterium]
MKNVVLILSLSVIVYGCSLFRKKDSVIIPLTPCEYFQSKINFIDSSASVTEQDMIGSWDVIENVVGFYENGCWDTANINIEDNIIYLKDGVFKAGIFKLPGEYELRNNGKVLYHYDAAARESFLEFQ